jgi:hypothetical protein
MQKESKFYAYLQLFVFKHVPSRDGRIFLHVLVSSSANLSKIIERNGHVNFRHLQSYSFCLQTEATTEIDFSSLPEYLN